jgi:thiol:disulfide interchange protein DsbD
MLRALTLTILICGVLPGQRLDPIKWALEIDLARPGGTARARLTATMDSGWHLYSMTTPPPPRPTRIALAANPAVSGVKIFTPPARRALDPNFQSETETYDERAVFLLDLEVKPDAAGEVPVAVEVRYQACDDTRCLPPTRRTAEALLRVVASAPVPPAIPPDYQLYTPAAASAPPVATPPPSAAATPAGGLLSLVPVAFGFGLLAVFTPCVFPMIPITMSYFLNRPDSGRASTLGHAALFCGGIIALFSMIGLAVTAVLGPFGVVRVGSNPWVNGFIAAIFFVFALSLLGAFELTIPSSVLTLLNRKSEQGGMAGTLIMGLAFSLSSFACVGPFVGPLLAASAQGGRLQPVVGMVSFAAGLSLPFFFLAAFPSYLKRMPRSGGWLPRVKIVMGFILLAVMLKYLSSVDQVLQWNLLTRERFLAAWIVLFAMPGLYLLGFVRLEGVSRDEPVGLGRLFTALAFLVFSLSLVPGIWGARLGELDAYVPLPAQAGFSAASAGGASLTWSKNNLNEALARAKSEGKPVLVSFTGYACTNCHWMKANMFTRPEIARAMSGFVLVELYTDGADAASEENQRLQESRFQTVAIPYYAILDGDGQTVASFPGLTRKPDEFLEFLNQGAAKKGDAS